MPNKRPTEIHELRKPPAGEEGKWHQLGKTETRGRLTWADAGAEDLLDAVAAATEDGAAVLLSKTSDGGALCIQIWNGQGRHKLYPASMAELNESLSLIKEIAESP